MSGASTVGLLHYLLDYDFGSDLEHYADRLLKWELAVASYDKQNPLEELSDNIKKAVLIRGVPEPLRSQLQLAEPGLRYKDLRMNIEGYLKAQICWQLPLADSSSSSCSPAESKQVFSLKGFKGYKCKGKGKGKEGGKGG